MHRYLALFCFAVVATPQNQPTFQAGTRLVEVDVVVRNKSGPVAGLTKDDFTLFDEGKPQQISVFSVRAARSSKAPPVLLPPGAVSNRLNAPGEAAARSTVILLDQKNTPQTSQAFAIQRIVKFVQMRRGKDRIGIYTFGKDHVLRGVQELTDDAELLSKAANSLKARDPVYRSLDTTGMTEHEAQGLMALELRERGMDTRHALEAIARHLAKVPGRKTLIWVTTSFPLVVEVLGIDFRPDMEEAAHALNEANVALYAVDAHGLMGALSSIPGVPTAESAGPRPPGLLLQQSRGGGKNPDPQDRRTMAMLAGLTGGLLFYDNSNGLEDSMQTAMDDGEVTYTLGFYPQQEERDGVWHKLKVEVDRRGASVRHRQNYFASRAVNDRPTLEELLNDSLDATQLELVAEAAPDTARPDSYRIKVNVDLHDVQLAHENARWSGGVDVSFLMEGSGTLQTKTLKIDVPDDQLATFLEKGIDAVESIDAAGSARGVRVVVQDRATGAAGSIRIPFGRK